MINNDILRRTRYLFDYNDDKMISIFKTVNYDIDQAKLKAWLRKAEDPLLLEMKDEELATFLNGLIIERRGKKEGPQPEAESILNNNIILRKIKIALNLQAEDMLELFTIADKKISKGELSAFFRKPGHKSYRPCLDQYLRSFFNALQRKKTQIKLNKPIISK